VICLWQAEITLIGIFVWGIFLGKEKSTGKDVSLDVHEMLKIENGNIKG